MKLLDLMEVTRPNTKRDVEAILEPAGYRHIGSGAHADVFYKEGANYVLKVFNTADSCYMRFLDTVTKNPNPHFPKVIGKPVKISNLMTAIRLEILTKYNGGPELVRKIQQGLLIMEGMVKKGMKPSESFQRFIDENPDLANAMMLIAREVIVPTSCGIDMREQNLMMRGDTVVIIDPVI